VDSNHTLSAITGNVEFHEEGTYYFRSGRQWVRLGGMPTSTQEARERFQSLSAREREVVAMVVSGRLNKQIAAEIGTTENTVKVHRRRAMEKMQAESLADLVKMVERLETLPEKAS
jgi:DNA-binding NarL/FixJ family response regulator